MFYSIALCLYSEEMPFPRFGAGDPDEPTSSREPSCLCLALSWHYRVLWGILYSLNHEYLDLNSGLQKFGASILQL